MTGEVRIRRATPGDARRIGAVHVQAWQEAYAGLLPPNEVARWGATSRAAMWRRAIVSGTARGIYVAEIDGVIIGFGACADQRAAALDQRGYTGEITALYVLRMAQRRGAGQALMRALARRLIAEGDRAMALWVLASNAPARRFYEAMGGRVIADHGAADPRQDEIAYGWTDIGAVVARAA
ncbi:MAG: GNAT family N-acetyltransferase [Sphingomonas sp.]